MQDLKQFLADEKKKRNQEVSRVEVLEKLYKRFPSLQRHVSRWNHERFCSPEINPLCMNYEMAHNCGCCPDSPLELWPYAIFEGMKLFASPIPFCIGEKSMYRKSGERSYNGWQEKLRKHKIPEEIITRVEKVFEGENEEWDDDEE